MYVDSSSTAAIESGKGFEGKWRYFDQKYILKTFVVVPSYVQCLQNLRNKEMEKN